jgi:hypothetical protein
VCYVYTFVSTIWLSDILTVGNFDVDILTVGNLNVGKRTWHQKFCFFPVLYKTDALLRTENTIFSLNLLNALQFAITVYLTTPTCVC